MHKHGVTVCPAQLVLVVVSQLDLVAVVQSVQAEVSLSAQVVGVPLVQTAGSRLAPAVGNQSDLTAGSH